MLRALILGSSAQSMLFRWGRSLPGYNPFSLHHALSSRTYPFSLCIVLLSWDDTYLVCALCSSPAFAHSICILNINGLSSWVIVHSICASCYHPGLTHLVSTFDYCALNLSRYLFSLRFALSSGVHSFNLCILSSHTLELVYKPLEKFSKNSIKVSLHPLPPKVRRVQWILWTFILL